MTHAFQNEEEPSMTKQSPTGVPDRPGRELIAYLRGLTTETRIEEIARLRALLDRRQAMVAEIYHPVEASIVRLGLGIEPENRVGGLDLWDDAKLVPQGTIHLEPDADGKRNDERALSHATARLVLAGFEDRLPAFLFRLPGGDISSTRKPRAPRKNRIQALPIPLFGINWADSGPGISWPEEFRLGWLPGFDLWVVTASRDTPEIDGYCDRVLGHFVPCVNPVQKACEFVCEDWRRQFDSYGQERWAYVISTGRVDDGEAAALADVVWSEEDTG